jgi:hypothetical protein
MSLMEIYRIDKNVKIRFDNNIKPDGAIAAYNFIDDEIVLNKKVLDGFSNYNVLAVLGHEATHRYYEQNHTLHRLECELLGITGHILGAIDSKVYKRRMELLDKTGKINHIAGYILGFIDNKFYKGRIELLDKVAKMSHNKEFEELCDKNGFAK